MIDGAQRRLAAALGVSALLHMWLVHTAQGPQVQHAPRTVTNSGASITVSLEPPVDLLTPDSDLRIVRSEGSETIQTTVVSDGQTATKAVGRPAAAMVADTTDGRAALPQPNDPTYYTALNLDVYPMAATQLDLGVFLSNGSHAKGEVRATVLIDEAGMVNEVRAIQADASDVESVARALLLQTRFTPARKDGRIVKAQVQVRLDYGARQAQ